MALATQEAIRDRVYALIEAVTPSLLTTPKFLRYRNEGGADFMAWADGPGIGGCLRRFQVRQVGTDDVPETSSGLEERVRSTLRILVAYPQTHRYGAANAMDRDDVMNADWREINRAVGIYGSGNFSGSHDCIPLGATMDFERGTKVDYLLINVRIEYLRSTT